MARRFDPSRRTMLAKGGLAPLVAVVLAGCGLLGGSDDEPRPLTCPRVAVVSEAQSMTRFSGGGGQDLTDVDYEAFITDVASGCEYQGDPEDGNHGVTIALAPIIAATRGPANADRQADFAYFVSVVDADGAILNKQIFPTALTFPGNRTRVILQDDNPPISIDIPLGTRSSAGDYAVVLGLQLSREELEYNRRRNGLVR